MAKDRTIYIVKNEGDKKPLVYPSKALMFECQLNPLSTSDSTTYWRRRKEAKEDEAVELNGCTIWEDVLRERHIVEADNSPIV